jgi:hypothetical protein
MQLYYLTILDALIMKPCYFGKMNALVVTQNYISAASNLYSRFSFPFRLPLRVCLTCTSIIYLLTPLVRCIHQVLGGPTGMID